MEGLDEVFSGPRSKGRSEHEETVRALHAKIGELTVERDSFSSRIGELSREDRLAMVERGGRLSLRHQSELLEFSRSSLYYTPRGASAEDLALMRRLDELYLGHPFYGSRQMVRHLRREGRAVGRDRVRQACPRGLRHSYGVAAVAAGVPLPTIAAVLGHASLTTTAIRAEARELVSRVWA